MPVFQAVRRHKGWKAVIPVYDGRRCPDCAAVVLGDKGQGEHAAYHEAQREWQEQVTQAIEQTARGAGLTVGQALDGGELHGLDHADDSGDGRPRRRVPWRVAVAPDQDDDEED